VTWRVPANLPLEGDLTDPLDFGLALAEVASADGALTEQNLRAGGFPYTQVGESALYAIGHVYDDPDWQEGISPYWLNYYDGIDIATSGWVLPAGWYEIPSNGAWNRVTGALWTGEVGEGFLDIIVSFQAGARDSHFIEALPQTIYSTSTNNGPRQVKYGILATIEIDGEAVGEVQVPGVELGNDPDCGIGWWWDRPVTLRLNWPVEAGYHEVALVVRSTRPDHGEDYHEGQYFVLNYEVIVESVRN
jgi:hypothetical protein